MARKDLEEIAAFAIERDLIVITDEIYGELTYDAPHTSIVSIPALRSDYFPARFLQSLGDDRFPARLRLWTAELIEA